MILLSFAVFESIRTTVLPLQGTTRHVKAEVLVSNSTVPASPTPTTSNLGRVASSWKLHDEINKTKKTIPPLSHYVDTETGSIKRINVKDLLNFVIVGFPKTGTTFIMRSWMGAHSDICMYPEEMHIRENGGVNWTLAMQRLHELSSSPFCQRAFKSPSFLRSQQGMRAIRDIWPHTKLIVGMRHPVTWFQSLYNYKIFRLNATLPPPAANMSCGEDGVCVENANFHSDLAKLGLTSLNDAREMDLLEVFKSFNRDKVLDPPPENKVLLYEYSELHTEDLRLALTGYLDLTTPLAKLGDYQNHQTLSKLPGQIDICKNEHSLVRRKLVNIGGAAAEWIEEFFMQSPSVVTTGTSFRNSIRQWKEDPCDYSSAD
ncbi:hypothetical protein ACA910_003917 [Epithemia clementina (nom. ined.)]